VDDDAKVEAIAQRISDYLAARPGAADTARGIADWWLADLGFPASIALVERALALLASHGAVVSGVNPDGNRIWRAGAAPPARPRNGG
jgi:hypothetical protein